MRRRWLSKRALLLHAGLIAVVSFCLAAGWWQVHRAMSGNLLSYGYAIEWPVFAAIAGVMWWQLIHGRPEKADTPGTDLIRSDIGRAGRPARRDQESPALQAYNDRLAALAASGRRKTWRNPKGLP